MTEKTIHAPQRVRNFVRKAAILFIVALFLGFIISFFSPYVTLTMDAGERLEFWIYLCLIGGIGIFITDWVVANLGVKWPGFVSALLQTIGGTIAVLIPLYQLYEPPEIPKFGTTLMFVWFVMVLILAVTHFVMGLLWSPKVADAATMPEGSSDASPAKILERLPVHLQSSELYALSAEDHYVRVHTSKGEELVLMRLSDAMTETGHFQGLQTHRSWWVAKAAVEKITPKGRTAEITLKSNITAPVSRNSLKTLRDAGWL